MFRCRPIITQVSIDLNPLRPRIWSLYMKGRHTFNTNKNTPNNQTHKTLIRPPETTRRAKRSLIRLPQQIRILHPPPQLPSLALQQTPKCHPIIHLLTRTSIPPTPQTPRSIHTNLSSPILIRRVSPRQRVVARQS